MEKWEFSRCKVEQGEDEYCAIERKIEEEFKVHDQTECKLEVRLNY